MDKYLKTYLKNNFSFSDLKKAGFFGKDIKHNDYEKQAERICKFFGLLNIYDYSKMNVGARYHLTDGRSLSFAETVRDKYGDEILKNLFE
jgi:hypothetical protein